MAIKSGFFNSVSGDRKYDAEDMNKFFDGVITDGVFQNIGNELEVTPNSGLQLSVDSGKAWFLKSWIENTSVHYVTIPTPDVTYGRIDIVAIDFDKTDGVRENDILVVEGTPAASPIPPTLIDTATHLQIPLAHIQVDANETVIQTADITDKRGTVDCPWVAGIVDLVVTVDDTTIQNTGNILAVKDGGITLAKMADNSVDTAEIVADAIDGSKIADNAIDSEHYTDLSIDRVHLSNDIIDGTKLADNAVNSEHYTDLSIDRVHLSNDIIDGSKIANDVINSEHYVAGSIDNEHIGDNQINSEHYAAGSIDAEHLAANIVDDTKLGYRVPMFTRRQGGNASDWSTAGTTNYTPTYVKMQGGSKLTGTINNGAQSTVNIQFPQAFSARPLVFAMAYPQRFTCHVDTVPAVDEVDIIVANDSGSNQSGTIIWFAVGPE